MKNNDQSLSEQYFDKVYDVNTDPWNFETSVYEKEKYAVTIHALNKKIYKNIFEVGCSIGVLSEMLAKRSENLLAVDASEAPLFKARQRLINSKNVVIEKMNIPADFITTPCDLIVLSEVAYYLNDGDLQILRDKTMQQLETGGQLLMVHWTPFVHDYPQTGDRVHEYFMEYANGSLKHLLHQRYDTYRLDLFEKN